MAPKTQNLGPGLVINDEEVIKERLRAPKKARMKTANESRLLGTANKHDRWQSEANQIWAAYPQLSKSAVALRISKRTRDSFSTIRHSIHKK